MVLLGLAGTASVVLDSYLSGGAEGMSPGLKSALLSIAALLHIVARVRDQDQAPPPSRIEEIKDRVMGEDAAAPSPAPATPTDPSPAPAAPATPEAPGSGPSTPRKELDDMDPSESFERVSTDPRLPARIRDVASRLLVFVPLAFFVGCLGVQTPDEESEPPPFAISVSHAWVEADSVHGLAEWWSSDEPTQLAIEGQMDAGLTICVYPLADGGCFETLTIGFLLEALDSPMVCWSTLGQSVEGCHVFFDDEEGE